MYDLVGNAANRSGDGGLPLPQRLGDGKAETFLDRFLDHNGRSALQSINLKRTPGRQVEDDNVRIIAGDLLDLFENECAFRIIACAAAGKDQLAIDIFSCQLESLYHANRILQSVETRDLGHNRAGAIN